ncbi:MAG: hypothetical protein WA921_14480 [Ahrensia sp.]
MSESNRSENNLVQIARDYALNVRPSRAQRQQFTVMMTGHFAGLSQRAQMEIANALCLCHHLDMQPASMIAAGPVDAVGRFLRFSPMLDSEFLAALILKGEYERNLCIARRKDLPKSVAHLLRDMDDPKINHALDLRQKPRNAPQSLAFSRPSIVEKIMSAAQARDLTSLCSLLMKRLSLTRESTFVLLADKSSANLIIALKFCGLGAEQAWEAYTMLAPGLAEKSGQREAFLAGFDAYDQDACARKVKNWVLEDLLAQVTAPPIANDDLGAPANQVFGPAGGLRKSA